MDTVHCGRRFHNADALHCGRGLFAHLYSMASGNGNGDSLNPVASPSAVEEVSNVLVPQIPAQLASPLFDDLAYFH